MSAAVLPLPDRAEYSVFWLLQPDLSPRAAKLLAVAVMTSVMSVLKSNHHVLRDTSATSVQCLLFESPFLQFAYLFTAIGLALSNDRFIELTAARIRRASRLMNAVKPEEVSKRLGVQLAITAIIFAVITVRAPPGFPARGRPVCWFCLRRCNRVGGLNERRRGLFWSKRSCRAEVACESSIGWSLLRKDCGFSELQGPCNAHCTPQGRPIVCLLLAQNGSDLNLELLPEFTQKRTPVGERAGAEAL